MSCRFSPSDIADGRAAAAAGEDVFLVSGLVAAQVVYAGNGVYLKDILSRGYDPLFVVVFSNLVFSAFFFPLALIFERKKWPMRISLGLMARFAIISFVGVTIYQVLSVLGVKKTSPTMASAMPNLLPASTFVIAACLRYERVAIGCKYGKAKVAGTLLCVCGAVTTTFLQIPTSNESPASYPSSSSLSPSPSFSVLTISQPAWTRAIPAIITGSYNLEWMIGCGYLLVAVVLLSCTTIVQAVVLQIFPAPITSSVICASLGALLTLPIQLLVRGKINATMNMQGVEFKDIVGITLSGIANGGCIVYQLWCMKRKGPVYVSVFNPVQTVASVVISSILLKQCIGIRSLLGTCLMILGLYIFLWATRKETCKKLLLVDAERALLS